jgi:hypothetical protein
MALSDRDFVPIAFVGQVKEPAMWKRDWVTIGVLATKSAPKRAKNNKKFISFVLTDLENNEMRLSLFDSAYEKNWTAALGAVFMILNGRPFE